MTFMTWTPAMSVGVDQLDNDHKGLIDVINDLAAESSGEGRAAVLRQSLVSLRRYAETHFGREEQVMRACGFPGLQGHHGEHEDFVTMIGEVTERLEADPEGAAAGVRDELVDYLKTWLNQHIMIQDMAYKPYVEEKRYEARDAAKSFKPGAIWRAS